MYLDKELLLKDYENPKQKLKDLLENCLKKAEKNYSNRNIDVTKMLETIGCINAYCQNNNFKKIKILHDTSNKGSHCYEYLRNYQSEFLIENEDLYSSYFGSYKYEFIPEKLQEIKELISSINEDIINDDSLNNEHKDSLLSTVDDLNTSLKLQTNDIDTFIGKLFRLHMKLESIGFKNTSIKKKINLIFQKIVTTESYINKVDSLINTGSRLLSYFN